MSTTETLVAIIVPVVIILALLGAGVWIMMRRRRLQERFGPEYERTVRSEDGRLAGERELRSREKRHDDLDIKKLSREDQERYAEQWKELQQGFVDKPDDSVVEADRLVTRLMKDRGYPVEDFDQRLKDLSVEHAATLEHYRAAHDVALHARHGGTTTEELRGAIVNCRTLFRELLNGPDGEPGQQGTTSRRGATGRRGATRHHAA
jgi:glycine/D-amino acid oxidase-like deaminating enzyme